MKTITTKDGLTFRTREGSLDEFVLNENCYKGCCFNKGDVWLDFGGNIGAFAVKYAPKVKAIISFEADETNHALLASNVKLNKVKNVETHNACVVGNADKTREFFLCTKKNKGAHSLLVKRGREKTTVRCVNVNDVFEKYSPNKLKIDVEGAELEILSALTEDNLTMLEEIVMEWHFSILRDTNHRILLDIVGRLRLNGFDVSYPEKVTGAWTGIVHAMKL